MDLIFLFIWDNPILIPIIIIIIIVCYKIKWKEEDKEKELHKKRLEENLKKEREEENKLRKEIESLKAYETEESYGFEEIEKDIAQYKKEMNSLIKKIKTEAGIPELPCLDNETILKYVIPAVKSRLISPLSAIFCDASELAFKKKKNRYKVLGFVNSQNKYGALTKETFLVFFEIGPNENIIIYGNFLGDKEVQKYFGIQLFSNDDEIIKNLMKLDKSDSKRASLEMLLEMGLKNNKGVF